jgi:YD repeat-containing protein
MTHYLTAGGVFALVVSPGVTPAESVKTREQELSGLPAGAPEEDLDEARAQVAAARYARGIEEGARRIMGLERYATVKDVTEALAGRPVYASFGFGLPLSVTKSGYTIDVGRESSTPVSVDRDQPRSVVLNKLVGFEGSSLEHRSWEAVLNTEGVSAVKAIQAASASGIPILTIDSTNYATQVAQLSGYAPESLTEVSNAAQAKNVVTIPQRTVSYKQYPGVEGYIITDPQDGTGLYRLGALLNGGEASGASDASGPGNGTTPCSEAGGPTGSYARYSDGDFSERITDLSLPSTGIPIALTRMYRSRANINTALGWGWSHSYGVSLTANADGSLTYLTEDLRRLEFKPSGPNAWTPPPGWYQAVTKDASGYTMRFKDGLVYLFDLTGKLVSQKEPNGNAVTLGYDSLSRLSTVTDSAGRVALSLSYDAAGKLSSLVDAANRRVSFGHTGEDLTSATDVLGATESYGYSEKHLLISRTDKGGNLYTELYDEYGRWTGVIDPAGNRQQVLYDALTSKAAVTDRTGRTTIWEWNAAGNPTKVTNPTGEVRSMSWDSAMNKLTETDGTGATWRYTPDSRGNVTVRRDPAGNQVNYSYDPTYSRLVSQNGAVPNSVTNTYDSLGNLKTSRDGQSNTTTYDYDAQGRVKTVTQPGSAVTTLSYNADGSVAAITDGEGGLTQLGYDGAGHLTALTDASGNTRTLTPNAAGQVLSIKDGLGGTTTFTYDALGNRKTATDAAGKTTAFGHDVLGRLTSVTDALGNVTRIEFDAEGRVTARVDVRGNRTEYHFDQVGRLSETVGPDGAVTSYGYCADQGAPSCSGGSCGGSSGQACEIVDPLGNVTTLKQDSLGRETTRTDPLGHVTATKYQSNGLVQQVFDQLGNVTNYSYDGAGRLKSATPASGGSSYDYDGRGNRTQVYDARNTLAASYTYDGANRLLTETNPLQQVTAYTYDKAGNRQTKTDGSGKVTSYAYDANRRLQTVVDGGQKVVHFTRRTRPPELCAGGQEED